MSLPRGGHKRIKLACVCKVNHDDTHGVLARTNISFSAGIRS